MNELLGFSIFAIFIFLAPILSRVSRFPIVVVEMLLGAFGAYYFEFLSSMSFVGLVADIGFLFLMFLCGLEVDIKSFVRLGSKFIFQALAYFVTLYGITCIVVFSFGLSFIYIAALPVMSLGMIVALIKDYGKNQPWLDLALKIGILGEIISIVVLVIIDGAAKNGFNVELAQKLLLLVGFIIVVIISFKFTKVLFWWFPQIKLLFLPKDDYNSQDIRFAIMLLFVLVLLMALLHIKAVLGAFIAGCIISTFFRHKPELPKKLHDFGFGFLVPFFFVYVGTTLELEAINSEILFHTSYLVLGMLSLRIIAGFVFSRYFKRFKYTLLFALSNSMPLTFLIATATLGKSIGELDEVLYASFVLGAILEGIIFSMLIKVIAMYWKR